MATATASVRDDTGVLIRISFDPAVTAVKVSRLLGGVPSVIRAGESVPLDTGKASVVDFEAPLDTPVSYQVDQVAPVGAATAVSDAVTVPSGGYSWLKDPGVPRNSLRIPAVTSLTSLARNARSGVMDVIGRATPLVITDVRRSPEGDLTVHTFTDDERLAMLAILAPGKVLLFQTPPAYGWGSQYVHVGNVTEARVGLAMEPTRRWTLPLVVVDPPFGLSAPPGGDVWADVVLTYATWDDEMAAKASWADLVAEVSP